MAKVKIIYEIPDTGTYGGGKVYDKYDNFKYFADVTGLSSTELSGADSIYTVKAHTRVPYMNAKGSINIPAQSRKVVTKVRMTKGALPGYTITLDDGTEKRQFQWTGTMSCMYTWLKDNAKVDVTLYGKTGTPYLEVPTADAGF